LKEKTGKRAEELAQAERNLTERIHKAGFADEAGYLSACLTEEARERLADGRRPWSRRKRNWTPSGWPIGGAGRGTRETSDGSARRDAREAIGACDST